MADTPLGEVILKNVRLSFAEIFKPGKPQKNDKGETVPGKYHCNFLLVKGTPEAKANMDKCKAAADAVKTDKWGKPEKWPKFKPEKVFLRDGDLEDWDGYEGCYYISANNPNPPVLIDNKKDDKGKWLELTLANGGTRRLYAGCYVNAIIRIWAQDSAEFGKRMNCSLESIQYFKKGDPFSGNKPVDPNGKFDDAVEDEDEEGESIGSSSAEREEEDSLI